MILYVSAVSRFMCVAILNLYFSEYLLISSLTVGIPRSLRISSELNVSKDFSDSTLFTGRHLSDNSLLSNNS